MAEAEPVKGLQGGGTYVYETGDLRVTVDFPASGQQENVRQLKSFLRKTRSPALQMVSVTVRNHTTEDFSVKGFRVLGEPGPVDLFPVASFISLAMSQPAAVNNQEIAMDGTIAALTSAVTVEAGATLTTLVATQQSVSRIDRIEYTPPDGEPVEVRPLWEIKQEAAKLARQQAREADQLARRQARQAREEARRAARGGA
ncbi:hypothetical protein [Kineosporia babensis]|uniref:Uncharacterized protein n=1 Tax=Kineosporia babensis TaxID=499548 RepID=A0A9X1NHW0_9ACTN|nr:hypothetical protein [Kineosporia babensis]MCD5315347.1 hypothetical protein [Kineosporia babensis]